jgi:hypothetical protein
MPPRRQSTDLETTISAIANAAALEISNAIRNELALQLRQLAGGGPAARRAASSGSSSSGGQVRRAGRGRLDEVTVSRVLKVVHDSPGLRTEEIQAKLPVAPKVVKAALAKLRRESRVKTTGQKRGMTYASR